MNSALHIRAGCSLSLNRCGGPETPCYERDHGAVDPNLAGQRHKEPRIGEDYFLAPAGRGGPHDRRRVMRRVLIATGASSSAR